MSKFKVGDRVEVFDYSKEWNGIGTVTGVSDNIVMVNFDPPRPAGFALGGFHEIHIRHHPSDTTQIDYDESRALGYEYKVIAITAPLGQMMGLAEKLTQELNHLDDSGFEVFDVSIDHDRNRAVIIARRAKDV